MHRTPNPEVEGRVSESLRTSTALRSGLLLVDKPAGVTSHDVVAHVRRAAQTKRVGHAGTLDPFATGLLVVAVGHATRLLPYLDDEPKVYEAQFRFGFETDSEDSTGMPTTTASLPDWSTLPDAIRQLTGAVQQVPPMYSAKHVHGERAYKKARRGELVELAPVAITVNEWQIIHRIEDRLSVRISCGGGTYIRSLARDLGRLMTSAAHCATLRRVQSGRCNIHDAVPWSALERGSVAGGAVKIVAPLSVLHAMSKVTLSESDEIDVRHGRSIAASHDGERASLVDTDENIVAIAIRTDDNRWQPRVVLPSDGVDVP